VENYKLKSKQQRSEAEMQCEQLAREMEELRQSLHEVQGNEVSCNEQLNASREEQEKLQRDRV